MMKIKSWIGSWESFENYISSTDELMINTWEEAESISKAHPGLSKMFKNGCMEFWKNACNTITDKNQKGIFGIDVRETESGIEIEWFSAENQSLGKAEYILDGTLNRGLEGKENTMLIAKDVSDDWVFRCILAMEPMPDREEKNQGGLLSHFHFQFANDWLELIENDKLKNPWWYATMCDKDATNKQKCNVVRALHKLPVL